jgi:superfamily II DNA helicase RecQ
MAGLKFTVPTLDELRSTVQNNFGVQPCTFQAHSALAQLEQRDCITISLTGSGKTLTFWIPLLFNDDGIIIIVTALNILGEKNVAELEKLGISAANVTGESATDELFKVLSLYSTGLSSLSDLTFIRK